MNLEKSISKSSHNLNVSTCTTLLTTSSLLTLLTCSALVKKKVAKTHVKVTLVDHSSVLRMVNRFLSVSLHGAMVVLKLSIPASTLQSILWRSTDGLSLTWEKMELQIKFKG